MEGRQPAEMAIRDLDAKQITSKEEKDRKSFFSSIVGTCKEIARMFNY